MTRVTATVIGRNNNHAVHSPEGTSSTSPSSNDLTPEISDCNSTSNLTPLQNLSVASGSSSSTSAGTTKFSSSNKSTCTVGSTHQCQNSLLTLKQQMAIPQGQPFGADVIDAAQKLLLKHIFIPSEQPFKDRWHTNPP